MTLWNEQRLEELVRKMGLERSHGYEQSPIHLSLYNSPYADAYPLLTQIMTLDVNTWVAMGYAETDRVSVVQYLGSLGCRTDGALLRAVEYQRLLSLDLAKLLIDAGARNKEALSVAAEYQRPLTLELAKLLIDAGAFDEKALSKAARYQQPLSFDLAKLLIDAGAFDGVFNEYALSYAARYQRPLTLELAKLLIDAGAFNKGALSNAAECQRPLTLELAKLLIDAGAFDKKPLSWAAIYQQPLTLELAKLLIDASCDPTAQSGNGLDALVFLAWGGHPVDPQVTDLFLSAGCRTDLDGCTGIFDEHRLRFGQILKEHAEWKKQRDRLLAENSPTGSPMDWGR